MVIGRTLNTTEYRGLLPTDVTNVIRVVRFHGTVLSLTKHKTKSSESASKVNIYCIFEKTRIWTVGTCKASMSNCVRSFEHVHFSNVQPQPNMKLVLDQICGWRPSEPYRRQKMKSFDYGSTFHLPPDISVLHSITAPTKMSFLGVTPKRKNIN